jgi:hypothetical protein
VFQLLAQLRDRLIAMTVMRRDPRIHLAAQNSFYTQPSSIPVSSVVVKGDTIVLSSGWFWGIGAPGVSHLAAFTEKTQAEVERRLQAFLNGHPGVSPQMTGTLVIDIEDPHPQDLHKLTPEEQLAVIEAFKTRIAATRAVFPNAKLALYGTINPDARGRAEDPVYLKRLAALVAAGKQGMFDKLDYLVPVLYVRFGPTDAHWLTLTAYTKLGVTGAKKLRRSDGSKLAILPIIGLRVSNGNSKHHDELLIDLPTADALRDTFYRQLDVFYEAGIPDVVLWVGNDSDLLGAPNPRARTVSDHLG